MNMETVSFWSLEAFAKKLGMTAEDLASSLDDSSSITRGAASHSLYAAYLIINEVFPDKTCDDFEGIDANDLVDVES